MATSSDKQHSTVEQPRSDSIPPTLPVPTLSIDWSISVTLNPIVRVGQGPWGTRNWISFTGGTFTAAWATGKIHPGGQDSQLVLADRSTRVAAHYLIETADEPPAFIVARTEGWRTGPREVLDRLLSGHGDTVDPSEYSFRLFINLETGDERYAFLNTGMWVGSGARKGAEVSYDAYRVG